MGKNTTTISIDKELANQIQRLKVHERQPSSEIIEKLVAYWNNNGKGYKPELYPNTNTQKLNNENRTENGNRTNSTNKGV